MERLYQTFRTSPPITQLIIIGAVVLLLVIVGGGIGGAVSAWKDARFDKKEARRETERQALEIGRAVAAEAKAVELESQRQVLELAIEAQGAKAVAAQEAIENEDKKLQDELAAVDADIDPCERTRRLCDRLKRLNLYPASKPCDCQ
jgi:uncharacterized protein YlxW (UPF0749 family)